MDSSIWKPLDTKRKEIRLCRLAASSDINEPPYITLDVVSLDSDPQYEAISYAWGDPSVTTPVILHGVEWPVTTNLATAFRYLRSPTNETIIWADAICINQKDIAERNAQVLIMVDIYPLHR